MSEKTYYKRNREVILNRAYRNDRDELKVKARDKYRELSEEENYENMEKTDIIIFLNIINKG